MRFLVFIFLVAVSTPAFAQSWGDNKIRVIGEDGSVQEIEIPKREAPPVEKPRPASALEPTPVPEPPSPAPVLDVKPMQDPLVSEPEKAIVKEEVPQELPPPSEPEVQEKKVKPAPKQAAPKAAPVPKNLYPNVPLPPRKPRFETPADPVDTTQEKTKPEKLQPVYLIGKERAKAIALEIAPPARSVIVQTRVLNGHPAYAVIFRTGEGPYEVLVDGISGNILSAP